MASDKSRSLLSLLPPTLIFLLLAFHFSSGHSTSAKITTEMLGSHLQGQRCFPPLAAPDEFHIVIAAVCLHDNSYMLTWISKLSLSNTQIFIYVRETGRWNGYTCAAEWNKQKVFDK